MVAEAIYLHIFIPLIREGPARGLSDLHVGVCVEEPMVPVCLYERLLNLGGSEVLHERSSGWK